ncbi:MAG: GNAT family N-acetyltransferase [Pseudomonadota bacterium]
MKFFQDLQLSGDDAFFHPHPTDAASIHQLAVQEGKDVYCLMVEGGKVLAYGLLRGWDQGYETPSLGLAVDGSVRGQGFGEMLIQLLHLLASRRGAKNVRLRVSPANRKALNLYERLGYTFAEDAGETGLLVGTKALAREPRR